MPGDRRRAGSPTPIGFGASFANAERRAMIERHLRRVNPTWSTWRLRQARAGRLRVATPATGSRASACRRCRRATVAAGHRRRRLRPRHRRARRRAPGRSSPCPTSAAGSGPAAGSPTSGNPVTVVVERIEPPELFDWFAELRAKLGMTVVPLGPDAGRATLQALTRNEIVCLLCDRDIGGGGVEVEFFGERTTLPAGPATLGAAHRRADPARRRVLHPPGQRPPRRRPPAAPGRAPRLAARRRRPRHPVPRRRARAPHPPGARAVAPVPAELAERPRIRRKAQLDQLIGCR